VRELTATVEGPEEAMVCMLNPSFVCSVKCVTKRNAQPSYIVLILHRHGARDQVSSLRLKASVTKASDRKPITLQGHPILTSRAAARCHVGILIGPW